MITATQIRKMATGPVNESNMVSFLDALNNYGPVIGLGKPHRDAQYISQMMHESGDFRFDHEIWGPTPAQKRYDTRTDLGNTAAVDGDGYLYRGRTGVQITGKANYKSFRDWCRETFPNLTVPDFVKYPDLVNTDPWEGIAPLWFWSTHNLNRYADQGNTEMITRIINGGYNGLQNRLMRYTRTGLVLLGRSPTAIKSFQQSVGLEADGIDGPKTRAALHKALKAA